MFDINDHSWVARSVPAERAEPEIAFYIAEGFSPDPNSAREEDDVALPRPTTVTDRRLTSTEAQKSESDLIGYYRSVLSLVEEHQQTYNDFSPYFWLKLTIGWESGELGFSWYDTLDPMESLFDWIQAAEDGDIWSDVEQGWEMICIRVGERFHFRQGGFDQGDEYENVALPREQLLQSVTVLRARIKAIISRLIAEIGEDYWTRYRYDLRTDLDMR